MKLTSRAGYTRARAFGVATPYGRRPGAARPFTDEGGVEVGVSLAGQEVEVFRWWELSPVFMRWAAFRGCR